MATETESDFAGDEDEGKETGKEEGGERVIATIRNEPDSIVQVIKRNSDYEIRQWNIVKGVAVVSIVQIQQHEIYSLLIALMEDLGMKMPTGFKVILKTMGEAA
jgi:hypothetical protein